jgi:hypothetical protein
MMLLLEAVAVALALVSLSDLYICNSSASAGRLYEAMPCCTEIGSIFALRGWVVPRLSRTHPRPPHRDLLQTEYKIHYTMYM